MTSLSAYHSSHQLLYSKYFSLHDFIFEFITPAVLIEDKKMTFGMYFIEELAILLCTMKIFLFICLLSLLLGWNSSLFRVSYWQITSRLNIKTSFFSSFREATIYIYGSLESRIIIVSALMMSSGLPIPSFVWSFFNCANYTKSDANNQKGIWFQVFLSSFAHISSFEKIF